MPYAVIIALSILFNPYNNLVLLSPFSEDEINWQVKITHLKSSSKYMAEPTFESKFRA